VLLSVSAGFSVVAAEEEEEEDGDEDEDDDEPGFSNPNRARNSSAGR
jgi:hypothetical protein